MDKENNKKSKYDLIWDSFLPFYLQYYWVKNCNDKWSLAWFHGERIKWMELYESGKIKRSPKN